jgi:hypothetical protein
MIYKSSIGHIYNLNAAASRDTSGMCTKDANLRSRFAPLKICFPSSYLPKLARDSLMTSIIDLAVQRSRPL